MIPRNYAKMCLNEIFYMPYTFAKYGNTHSLKVYYTYSVTTRAVMACSGEMWDVWMWRRNQPRITAAKSSPSPNSRGSVTTIVARGVSPSGTLEAGVRYSHHLYTVHSCSVTWEAPLCVYDVELYCVYCLQCSGGCGDGDGSRTRSVRCQAVNRQGIFIGFPDIFCVNDTQPVDTEQCTRDDSLCSDCEWVSSEWGQVSPRGISFIARHEV